MYAYCYVDGYVYAYVHLFITYTSPLYMYLGIYLCLVIHFVFLRILTIVRQLYTCICIASTLSLCQAMGRQVARELLTGPIGRDGAASLA